MASALTAITAAVVGVILNLAVDFSVHALWPPGGFDGFVLVLAVVAMVAMEKFKVGVMPVLVVCGLAGVVWGMG